MFLNIFVISGVSADDIAYNNHDLSDGLRAGLFDVGDLYDLPIVGNCLREVDKSHPSIDYPRKCHEALRRVFAIMVEDVLLESKKNLSDSYFVDADAVRDHHQKLIGFSDGFSRELFKIREFLFEKMYRHWKVNRLRFKAFRVVQGLFSMFFAQPDILPADWGNVAKSLGEIERARLICDYIAGMTDQYALMEYRKLTDNDIFMT